MKSSMLQHFGIIKGKDFRAMPPVKQEELLLKLGSHQVKHRIGIPRNNEFIALIATPENRIVVPTKETEQELYHFLIEKFEPEIDLQHLEFFYGYNEEVYGLKQGEKKKLGLFYFKLYCERVKNHSVQFMRERQSSNGITLPESSPKLEILLDQQNALISRIARSPLLIDYLLGNAKAFSREKINEEPLISELVDFEGGLKIVRNLNALFSFEIDPFVNPATNNAIVNVVAEPEMAPTDKKPVVSKPEIKKKKQGRLSNEEARRYLLETVFKATVD